MKLVHAYWYASFIKSEIGILLQMVLTLTAMSVEFTVCRSYVHAEHDLKKM